MFDNILTETLILAIASLSFISVDILCELAMLPDMYILLSPQGRRRILPAEGTDVRTWKHIHQKH